MPQSPSPQASWGVARAQRPLTWQRRPGWAPRREHKEVRADSWQPESVMRNAAQSTGGMVETVSRWPRRGDRRQDSQGIRTRIAVTWMADLGHSQDHSPQGSRTTKEPNHGFRHVRIIRMPMHWNWDTYQELRPKESWKSPGSGLTLKRRQWLNS